MTHTLTSSGLLVFAIANAANDNAGDERTPREIIQSAVGAIDEHYLYPRSNAWHTAKEELLAGARNGR